MNHGRSISMSDYENIKKQAAEYAKAHRRVEETFQRCSESREARAAWEQACDEFHRCDSPLRFIESAEGRRQLREGSPPLVEHAIAFLELDPYFFRSGYAKEVIIRCLKRLPLSNHQVQRLQGVVLRALDKWDRVEFRAYCRLAGAVDSPAFYDWIRERLDSPDAGVRRRARCLLDYVDERRRHSKVSQQLQ